MKIRPTTRFFVFNFKKYSGVLEFNEQVIPSIYILILNCDFDSSLLF